MKRTLYPKLCGLILCLLSWTIWPTAVALPLSVGIVCVLILALTLPVFDPRSNFYIPTLAVAPERSSAIALTFDDGPDPRFTLEILDYLEREAILAAFFIVGSRARKYPEIVREIIRRGHIVAGHSYRHDNCYHFATPTRLHRDFAEFDQVVGEILGLKCCLYRAPQGFRTPILSDVLRARNLICVGWSARGFDSIRTSGQKIFRSLSKNLSGGNILLLHDGGGLGGREGREATVEALPLLVAAARAKGLRFERLDTLLGVEAYAAFEPGIEAVIASIPSPKERRSVRSGIKNPLPQTVGH